jgi:hypothetical protein
MKTKTKQRSLGKLAEFFRSLGSGLITGHDPSGIGTYFAREQHRDSTADA